MANRSRVSGVAQNFSYDPAPRSLSLGPRRLPPPVAFVSFDSRIVASNYFSRYSSSDMLALATFPIILELLFLKFMEAVVVLPRFKLSLESLTEPSGLFLPVPLR